MKLSIELNKEAVIDFFKVSIKNITSFLYSWFTTDGEVLGYILATWHIIIAVSLIICILLSHTVYPYVWFQFGCFIFLFFIWVQHVLLHVCVVISVESEFTNKTAPFYTILHTITNINLKEYGSYILVAETVAICCFFLELLGKFSLFLFDCYTNNAFAVC